MLSMDDFLPIRDHTPGYKKHWVYTDLGMPVMAVARYELGNKKTYRQFVLQSGEWVEGMPPSPYPLFGLHTLKNSSPLKAVIITEGEKCASVLHQLDWPTISTVLGSQNPSSSDWTPIRYYKCFIIFRDNDPAGIAFARLVTAEVRRIYPDAEVFVVNFTPNVPRGDLVDWLQTTVLRGQEWDGFEVIPSAMTVAVRQALLKEIENVMVSVEDCPHVAFKPIEALFESAPKSLKVELTPVPPFPVHLFPEEINRFLALTSAQYSQIPDFAATTFIVAVAGLIGRSVHLRMRPKDSWQETTNCWSVLIGSPSAKKSPIMLSAL